MAISINDESDDVYVFQLAYMCNVVNAHLGDEDLEKLVAEEAVRMEANINKGLQFENIRKILHTINCSIEL